MKVTFISFYFVNPGLRFLSSYLKNHGYDVDLIFLPPDNMYDVSEAYPDGILDDLRNLCAHSDIIGFSVFTNDFHRAARITGYLKGRTKAPILWGGIHPTIDPGSCPPEVDYVFVGEGEKGLVKAISQFERTGSMKGSDNIYYRDNGELRRGSLSPLLREGELDHFQDFDLDHHYVRQGDKIVKITPDIAQNSFHKDFENANPTYLTIFSRGCIHGCAYCCNNAINRLYSGDLPIYRAKTVNGMISELKHVLRKFPFIKFIYINDDNFMTNTVQRLKEFSERYKKEIALPFTVYGSPLTTTEEKMRVLKEAGLREVHIGVQSGSERMNETIYKRRMSNESVERIAALVNKFDLRGRYDFIFDNPYETTRDLLDTARLILRLPKPYIFQSFSLTFYPGTELYQIAKKDGKIFDEKTQVFEKVSNRFCEDNVSYLKLLCVLLPRMPKALGSVMISRPMVFIFHRKIFNKLYSLIYIALYSLKEKMRISMRSLYKDNKPRAG